LKDKENEDIVNKIRNTYYAYDNSSSNKNEDMYGMVNTQKLYTGNCRTSRQSYGAAERQQNNNTVQRKLQAINKYFSDST
jgi:hypothetical protein